MAGDSGVSVCGPAPVLSFLPKFKFTASQSVGMTAVTLSAPHSLTSVILLQTDQSNIHCRSKLFNAKVAAGHSAGREFVVMTGSAICESGEEKTALCLTSVWK